MTLITPIIFEDALEFIGRPNRMFYLWSHVTEAGPCYVCQIGLRVKRDDGGPLGALWEWVRYNGNGDTPRAAVEDALRDRRLYPKDETSEEG
jgi:hypothetical protein